MSYPEKILSLFDSASRVLDYYSDATDSDNELICWGSYLIDGVWDQFTQYNQTITPKLVPLKSNLRAKSFSASNEHACAILNNNDLICWGYNFQGALGDGTTTKKNNPIFAPTINLGSGHAKSIFCGSGFTCVILNDDNMKCWGGNSNGQLGDGTYIDRINATLVNIIDFGGGKTVKLASVGYFFSCAILVDDTMKCWGLNNHGQIGDATNTNINNPSTKPPINLGIGKIPKSVSCGSAHTCSIFLDNTMKCWGSNSYYELGDGTNTNRNDPSLLATINLGLGRYAVQVSCGGGFTCVILDDGNLKCWGNNEGGQLGDGTYINRPNPTDTVNVNLGIAESAKMIASSWDHVCVFLESNKVKCWGANYSGQVTNGIQNISNIPYLNFGNNELVTSIASGSYYSCAMLDNIKLKCWGGFIGWDWNVTNENVINMGNAKIPKSIFTGFDHVCSILNDDTLKCWGYNSDGQLGNVLPLSYYSSPELLDVVDIGVGKTARKVGCGYLFTCVILNDDNMKCWGANTYGQLGTGNTQSYSDQRLLPVLDLGRTCKDVSCGYFHVCVILSDDNLKCWGNNEYGQLGDGTNIHKSNATSINNVDFGGKTVKQVTCGWYHTCAILSDDNLKCWGLNYYGQLGDGTNIDQNNPNLINNLNLGFELNAISVSCGDYHTCIILNNNKMKCWGMNYYGQLGDGTDTNRNNATESLIVTTAGEKNRKTD